jgi:hypothetical protein
MLAFVPMAVGVHLTAQSKAPAKKTAAKTTKAAPKSTAKSHSTKKSATAKKGTAGKSSKSSASARKGSRTGSRQPAVTWRNRQSVPSSDRYRDIQSALAAKGYLRKEDATGEWNSASVDALKRFQSEQSLQPTGKLNSLSLIALGLGPKYEAKAIPPPANPQPPPQ